MTPRYHPCRRCGTPRLATAAVVAAATLLVGSASPSSAELIQLQVIHRHGARTPLNKDAGLSVAGFEGGAQLLGEGVEQLELLGKTVRNVYLLDTQSAIVGETFKDGAVLAGATGAYKRPTDFRAVSSALDRTLASSRAFVAGLYPADETRVPTYMFHNDPDDYLLRGHALCPSHAAKVRSWYGSDEFRDEEERSAALRTKWAALAGVEDDSLANWFNVYDRVFLHQYGLKKSSGLPTQVPSNEFEAIQRLASWLESNKYGPVNDGHLVASALLGEVLERANAADAAAPSLSRPDDESDAAAVAATVSDGDAGVAQDNDLPRVHRLIEYSAHYPTLLGLLTALGIPLSEVEPDGALPNFGAALLLELHRSPNERTTLAARWYGGGVRTPRPGLTYDHFLTNVSNAALCGDGAPRDGRCPLTEVAGRTAARVASSAAEWCAACGNTDESPLCFAAARGVASSADRADRGGGGDDDDGGGGGLARGVVAVVAFVGGVVVALAAVMAVTWLRGRRVRQSWAAGAAPMGAAGAAKEGEGGVGCRMGGGLEGGMGAAGGAAVGVVAPRSFRGDVPVAL
ncbi:hypothetical protein BU14_0076s0064 [Porphyra umbilicalis]|uniref:Acid phosphatase n=1 Tax=Porphyra umbilicalis TaxID=2786 RepID=A0A1X6PF95_PORUM|nr:hypothetical protein BU14_0076s0064 [Porphyra umbilicalis]|eukprot:OSX79508.1 hypothetical protein BU14_0076s0064 [Porphyra umbilicalis]